MEYQKIINLRNNTPSQPFKFKTKKWVEINDDSRGKYVGAPAADLGSNCFFAPSDTAPQLPCLFISFKKHQKDQVYCGNCSPHSFFYVVLYVFACQVFIGLVASRLPSSYPFE